MKRISLILMFAFGISLAMDAADNSMEISLPKLSFHDGRLQQLANLAEARYKSEEGKCDFEEYPEKWSGKPWQLMMLKYMMSVNDVLIMTDRNGNAMYDFSDSEAEQVQTAMMQKYFEGRKIAVPADLAGRFNLVEKHVKAFEKDIEFLADGPQVELNYVAGVGVVLKHYLELRLSREICEKNANTELQSFISQEENLYEDFYNKLTDSHGKYLLLTNGGGVYYSMWPLEFSGFAQKMLEQRIVSLKRLATAVNIKGFVVPAPAGGNETALEEEINGVVRSYFEYIDNNEADNAQASREAGDALKKAMEAYSYYLQSRRDLGDYIPNKRYEPLLKETVDYMHLMIDAHRGDYAE